VPLFVGMRESSIKQMSFSVSSAPLDVTELSKSIQQLILANTGCLFKGSLHAKIHRKLLVRMNRKPLFHFKINTRYNR